MGSESASRRLLRREGLSVQKACSQLRCPFSSVFLCLLPLSWEASEPLQTLPLQIAFSGTERDNLAIMPTATAPQKARLLSSLHYSRTVIGVPSSFLLNPQKGERASPAKSPVACRTVTAALKCCPRLVLFWVHFSVKRNFLRHERHALRALHTTVPGALLRPHSANVPYLYSCSEQTCIRQPLLGQRYFCLRTANSPINRRRLWQ